MSHAELSPSGSHRWMHCPGSIAACRGIESKDSVYSREGTFAHEVAALCLAQGIDAQARIGQTSPGGEFAVTEEMAGHIQVYLDAVRSTLALDEGELLIEQPVKVTDDIYGTADAVILGETMHVFDLKYGSGVYVEVEQNPQLLTYALGAVLGKPTDATQVAMHVVQPRHHADRSWRTSRIKTGFLTGVFQPRLLAAAEATKKPDAPLNPGDWCTFCSAKPTCPALRKRALATVQSVFTNLDLAVAPVKPPSPANLTDSQLATVLVGADIVKTWLKAVEDVAFERLKAGGEIPGFKLVEKRGNRKWTDEAAAQRELEATGVDPFAPREVVSPAQAEKLLAKKMSKGNAERLVERLAHKPVTGTTVVPSSDARPALSPGHAFTPIAD